MKIGRKERYIDDGGQMSSLTKALQIGAPLAIALQYARIPMYVYEEAKEIADSIAKAKELSLIDEGTDEELESNGIDAQTIHDYRAKKENVLACEKLIGNIDTWTMEGVMYHLIRVSNKDKFTNWQASAWMLERRYPQYFAKDENGKTETKAAPIKIQYIDPESDKERLARMEKELDDDKR